MSDPTLDPLEGGLRDRMVFQSAERWIREGLRRRNWFETTLANSGTQALQFLTEPVPAREKVTTNLVVVTTGPMDPAGPGAEIGSNLTEDQTELWATIYAESEAVGRHLQGDIYGWMSGKMPSIDGEATGFTAYDWTDDPETLVYPPTGLPELFWVEVEDVHTDREHDPETGVERKTWYVMARMTEYR